MVTWALLPRWASPLLILSPHLSRRNLLPSTIYSTALLGRTSGRLLHISSSIPPARIGRQVRARNSNRLPGSCSFCCGVEASVAVASDDNYGNKQVISVTPRLYDYLLTNVREPEVNYSYCFSLYSSRDSRFEILRHNWGLFGRKVDFFWYY